MDYSQKFQQCTIYVLFIPESACTLAHSKGMLLRCIIKKTIFLFDTKKKYLKNYIFKLYIGNLFKKCQGNLFNVQNHICNYYPVGFAQLICNRHNTHLPIIETDEEKAIIDRIAANTESQ